MSKPTPRRPRMGPDAYAGFIRLLLTPLSKEPSPSRELSAYLKFLRQAAVYEGAAEADHGRAA